MKDFYYILGTASDAGTDEIEAAYQKLARKFMDEQDAFMNAHFCEITEAYDILRDERRRRKYDTALRRSQRRHLAAFRLKYINVAVTLTFLVVTGLFAAYVMRNLQGHPKNTTSQPTTQTTVAASAMPGHAKKHHKFVIAPAKAKEKQAEAPAAVKTVPAAHPATPVPPDSTYTTMLHANVTGIIYLHRSPDYGSAVLAKLPDATEVRVLQKGADWYKVSFNGQDGYVIKSAVEH
ncbi:MAG: DnaJ domain-containing protein [Bacteroidetes bacterium]|nr:DnaJ domain-containing protein [Bacteroidota bacterium]